MGSRTVYRVLEQTAAEHGELAALHQPLTEGNEKKYRTWSWIEYKRTAEEIAAGLRQLGLRKGDIVALVSETRAEFYLADLGIMTSGAIAAALYTSYPAADQVRSLEACDAKAVFVESAAMMAKLRSAGPPLNVQWIMLSGEAEGALPLSELRALGRQALDKDPSLLAAILNEVVPADPAILYLTSGATGEPKMAIVTHEALVSNMDMGPAALGMGPQDSALAFLPSAHITQRIVTELLPLRCGIPVWFSASLMSLPHELQSIRPTLFVAPPRFWERVYKSICAEVRKRSPLARKAFYAAIGLGLEATTRRQQGRELPRWLRSSLAVADRVVFHKMRARFGNRMRCCASGSAPLGKDLCDFYLAIGLPLIEGYGLTEGGVLTMNPLHQPRSGSIGKALPGVELRIASDGELLVKSPTLFSGYYNDPEATSHILENGWLHTGDIARIDGDQYVYITGRKKEVIITSNGKKIYPAQIETYFKLEPLVSNVLLVGDRKPWVSALVTVNTAEAEVLKGMEPYRGRPPAEIVTAPPVAKAVDQAVRRVNKHLAQFEQIRRHRILERDFTIESGELTATMKVRRGRALENFRDEVGALYAGKEE